ncbi:salivary glue protein Sgs-3-like [Nematostella vectensis]|uniref:salivary glue protein Sgs-3-like n=1 Tax=Nematostella vectensis TaxID=45351 RepID=UPI001390350D|nr:salivary glue protein Sgs-3-like [Nematostella vectensis]
MGGCSTDVSYSEKFSRARLWLKTLRSPIKINVIRPNPLSTFTTTARPNSQSTFTTSDIPNSQSTFTTSERPNSQSTFTTTARPNSQSTFTTTARPFQPTFTTTARPKSQSTSTTTARPNSLSTFTTTARPLQSTFTTTARPLQSTFTTTARPFQSTFTTTERPNSQSTLTQIGPMPKSTVNATARPNPHSAFTTTARPNPYSTIGSRYQETRNTPIGIPSNTRLSDPAPQQTCSTAYDNTGGTFDLMACNQTPLEGADHKKLRICMENNEEILTDYFSDIVMSGGYYEDFTPFNPEMQLGDMQDYFNQSLLNETFFWSEASDQKNQWRSDNPGMSNYAETATESSMMPLYDVIHQL